MIAVIKIKAIYCVHFLTLTFLGDVCDTLLTLDPIITIKRILLRAKYYVKAKSRDYPVFARLQVDTATFIANFI